MVCHKDGFSRLLTVEYHVKPSVFADSRKIIAGFVSIVFCKNVKTFLQLQDTRKFMLARIVAKARTDKIGDFTAFIREFDRIVFMAAYDGLFLVCRRR